MKASVSYTLDTQNGLLEAYGNSDCVAFVRKAYDCWDPKTNSEMKAEHVYLQMSPEDARELAEMLIKAADHADASKESLPRRQGRY